MRGHVDHQPNLFVHINLQELVPADHPLRPIKRMADEVLAAMSRTLTAAYAKRAEGGRRSVPPERLLKALLQSHASLKSLKHIEQLRRSAVAQSDEDGSETGAGWGPKDGNAWAIVRGETQSIRTHRSGTHPAARLHTKTESDDDPALHARRRNQATEPGEAVASIRRGESAEAKADGGSVRLVQTCRRAAPRPGLRAMEDPATGRDCSVCPEPAENRPAAGDIARASQCQSGQNRPGRA